MLFSGQALDDIVLLVIGDNVLCVHVHVCVYRTCSCVCVRA